MDFKNKNQGLKNESKKNEKGDLGQRILDWGRNTQGKYKNGGKPRKDNP